MKVRSKKRRVIQIAMSSTYYSVKNRVSDYLISALCNDGTIFIASRKTGWTEMPAIPQPAKNIDD